MSQPQIHNVLKGERKLTPELADRILVCFGITVLDLLNSSEVDIRLAPRDEHASFSAKMHSNVSAQAEIPSLPLEPKIPKKRPVRQSLSGEFDSIKTA